MVFKDHASVGVFAGSFDPFTLGHAEVVDQALEVFAKVIIGVGRSPTKDPLFSPDERATMISELWHHYPNVEVHTFSGLAVNFAKEQNCQILIRGLRTEADFSYEMPMAMTNKKIGNVMTLFFPTDPKFAYISSSLVREVARHAGDVSAFLPPQFVNLVENKMQTLKT